MEHMKQQASSAQAQAEEKKKKEEAKAAVTAKIARELFLQEVRANSLLSDVIYTLLFCSQLIYVIMLLNHKLRTCYKLLGEI